jgi:hypothetical protein
MSGTTKSGTSTSSSSGSASVTAAGGTLMAAPLAYEAMPEPKDIVQMEPKYHPNILPIYIAKVDPAFAAVIANAALSVDPPDPPAPAIANVYDESASAPALPGPNLFWPAPSGPAPTSVSGSSGTASVSGSGGTSGTTTKSA